MDILPSRKILVVVTVGGSTNSAPILEICKILHCRGHSIEFATLAEREHLTAPYPFVSAVHIIGRAITAEEDEELYIRFSKWDFVSSSGKKDFMDAKKFYDSFWTSSFQGLKTLVEEIRPDFIFADYQVEAAKDILFEYQIPLATMWPQMPWLMIPTKYIPGQPGMQQRCLTSEHASLWDRLYDGSYILRSLTVFGEYFWWTRSMRRAAGVFRMQKMQKKPDYLLFVNQMFGLEVPKDLPPLVNAVGPILSDDYTPLSPELEYFVEGKERVLYVAFGTHVILPSDMLEKIASGINAAVDSGHLDGVIWAIRSTARKQIGGTGKAADSRESLLAELVSSHNPKWCFVDFAPQRAVLAHPSTKLFLTHAGPSSANEGVYHGVPMIALGIYGDQLPNSMRLSSTGVAEMVKKDSSTLALDLHRSICLVLEDRNKHYAKDVLRLQRIAHITSRRKILAADLIEEHMYDHELRFEHGVQGKDMKLQNAARGRARHPMRLQTADMRMSWLKANNIDLYMVLGVPLVFSVAALTVGGSYFLK